MNDKDRICPKFFFHKIHSIFSEPKKKKENYAFTYP